MEQTIESHVDTNGVRLWYQARGNPDGPPVVLVMGVDASALWWPSELVDGLVGAGFRAILFDNRDVGLSSYIDWDQAPYGIDDMATDLIGLLAALACHEVHLVGMSMGGMISQLVAIRQPERIRSLTLISTTPGPAGWSPPNDAAFAGLDRPVESEDDLVALTVDFSRALAGSRFSFDEPFYRDLVARDVARGTNPNSSHQSVVPVAPPRIDDLRKLAVPTLVVHGTEDPIFPFDHAEALIDAIPGTSLVRWDEVGHEIPPQLAPELTRRLIQHLHSS